MSLEHFTVPENKEVLKQSEIQTGEREGRKRNIMRVYQRNTEANWKSPRWLKLKSFENEWINKVIVDCMPKNKININEFITI